MDSVLERDRMKRTEASESGITLVELLVGMVIIAMLTGAMASAFVTALNGSAPTRQRLRETNDAQVIASYLVKDAQAAGTTDPSRPGFPILDPDHDPYADIGVSMSNNAGCSSVPPLLRLKWFEPTGNYSPTGDRIVTAHVVVYSRSGSEIVRTECVGTGPSATFLPDVAPGTASSQTLARSVSTASASCDPIACPALPETVSLKVVETNDPQNSISPYTYTLTASVRPQGADAGNASTQTAFPLLSLGACNPAVAGITAEGSPTVVVYGSAAVNNSCFPTDFQGSPDFSATGGISIYDPPLPDPFATLAPPSPIDCVNGIHSGALGPGTYTNNVDVSDVTFDPGVYIFCDGLTLGGNIVAHDVLFYIANGEFNGNNADIVASAQTTGLYGSGLGGANIVIWQARGNNTMIELCCSNTGSGDFNGTIYAPSAIVKMKNADISVTSIISLGVQFGPGGGTNSTTIGTPPDTPLSLDTTSLPAWTVNRPYPGTTLAASGGFGGYVWTATGLPAGLSLEPQTGVISGTPTTANTYTVNLTVTDSSGAQAVKSLTLRINANPAITNPANLRNWTINRDYPGTQIVVSGGTSPFAWSANGLPPGLSMDALGVITGTPTELDTFSPITFTVVDAAGVSATRNYSMTINSPPSITGPASLPTDRTAGLAYPNTTVTGTSGTTPYSWSMSPVPDGLTINANTGTISGTPTTAGTYNITVSLTDGAGAVAIRNYSVTIKPGPGIATAALPIGERNRPYNFTLTPTNTGNPPYTWTSNPLPAGLTIGLNTGTISGTPTVSGTFPNVTVTITDADGASASKTYSLVIAPPPTINAPSDLDWTVSRNYPGTQVTATGGVTPFTWSVTGLPAGLSMSPAGVISGEPTSTGTSTATVTVVDSLGGTDTQTYTFTINPTPSITTSSLPDGERTVPYSMSIAAANGTPAYTWSASGLPNGLSINAATGVLSGTPAVAGPFDITFLVTDVAGASDSSTLHLTLHPAPSIGSGTLPDWTVGRPYPNTTLTNTGGQAPYTWSATNLPAGLTIDPTGPTAGTVSGTPTVANTYSVTVTVTDSLGGTGTKTYVVTINAAPSITTGSIPSWTVSYPYTNFTMSSAGGTQPVSWSATDLPTGLSMNSSGVITGTPTELGTFTPTVTVLDSADVIGTRSYTVQINSDPSITTSSLPDGEQNVAYSTTVAGTSGTMPYTWSATGLPGGLTISSGGTISGTPTVTGTFPVDLSLTDNAGAPAPTQSVTITLYPELLINAPASLQPWTINVPYPSVTATATGGTGTYSWSATGLPIGMSIDATGVISGTPTVSGTYTVTVIVTDTASPPVSKGRSYTLTINAAPSITTGSPCNVRKSNPISFTLARTGGTGPFTWSSPGFPAWGITVNSAGLLTGTAADSGSATFNVTVTDSTGAVATTSITLTAANGPQPPC